MSWPAKQKGFTIVELLIVIVVIGLLTAISSLQYVTIQKQTRDRQRESQVALIASSLERYYNNNGEYPPVYTMTNTSQSSVQTLTNSLNLASDSLVMPSAPDNTYSSLTAGTASSSAKPYQLYYTGSGSSCLDNPPTSTSGCNTFTLSYMSESTSSVITVNSHSH